MDQPFLLQRDGPFLLLLHVILFLNNPFGHFLICFAVDDDEEMDEDQVDSSQDPISMKIKWVRAFFMSFRKRNEGKCNGNLHMWLKLKLGDVHAIFVIFSHKPEQNRASKLS